MHISCKELGYFFGRENVELSAASDIGWYSFMYPLNTPLDFGMAQEAICHYLGFSELLAELKPMKLPRFIRFGVQSGFVVELTIYGDPQSGYYISSPNSSDLPTIAGIAIRWNKERVMADARVYYDVRELDFGRKQSFIEHTLESYGLLAVNARPVLNLFEQIGWISFLSFDPAKRMLKIDTSLISSHSAPERLSSSGDDDLLKTWEKLSSFGIRISYLSATWCWGAAVRYRAYGQASRLLTQRILRPVNKLQ